MKIITREGKQVEIKITPEKVKEIYGEWTGNNICMYVDWDMYFETRLTEINN